MNPPPSVLLTCAPPPMTWVPAGQVAVTSGTGSGGAFGIVADAETYWIGPLTAALLNFFFVRKPPPATAVPASAATSAITAMISVALGRRRRSFFIASPFPVAFDTPPALPRDRSAASTLATGRGDPYPRLRWICSGSCIPVTDCRALREGGSLGRGSRGLDDHDHLAGRPELRAGQEHAAHPAPLGLRPCQRTGIVVSETPGQHLLPMHPV